MAYNNIKSHRKKTGFHPLSTFFEKPQGVVVGKRKLFVEEHIVKLFP